jgi:divalent metal cation (Fe/Co/Zn/Cd) transporter
VVVIASVRSQPGTLGGVHTTTGVVGVSAVGLALTGVIELVVALLSGSVALLGDALHNLSDVSTSLAVFIGLPRLSQDSD